jgi:hypothetical protein
MKVTDLLKKESEFLLLLMVYLTKPLIANLYFQVFCDTCIVDPKYFLIWILLRHFLLTDPHALEDILPSNLSASCLPRSLYPL